MIYNWQHPEWPEFKYSLAEVEELLFDFAQKTGRVSGLLEGLPKEMQTEAIIDIMVSEAVKTSEIEGEYLSRQDVMSSIKNNLGLLQKLEKVHDQRAEGAAELMLDVRNSYADKLTEEKLYSWHQMLMKGNTVINAGQWRTHEEPMQVVSGAMGKERVHFEAPPSSRVPGEMTRFIQWFNETGPGGEDEIKKPVIRSALAHLYFESIHPFEDGNGRIGRAISEKVLSQGIKRPVLLSLSRTIESNKKAYYEALQTAQRSIEVTPWLSYFVQVTIDAQEDAERLIGFTLKKSKFFDRYKSQLNERQLKVISRMLEEGPKGFEGGMNARKYVSIAQTSKATATRDMQDLVERGIFIPSGGGRSTRYEINLS
ncbi:Fic family protein [Catalinimonas sp. 4WD22]|uniref:Fic family protein n=1 Tax=Catalinimonas locisalis TaxID=3133978 RepID=UPI0031013107